MFLLQHSFEIYKSRALLLRPKLKRFADVNNIDHFRQNVDQSLSKRAKVNQIRQIFAKLGPLFVKCFSKFDKFNKCE